MEEVIEVNHDGFCCQLCKPNIRVCGQFNDIFYVAVDIVTNEYWIGDASDHANLFYKFPEKPTKDVLNLVDEMEDGNDRIYDDQIAWIGKWNSHEPTFVFHPVLGHELYETLVKRGWEQDIHGHIYLYVVHEAAKMIETYEQGLLDKGIGNNEPVEWSKEKTEQIQNFIKQQSEKGTD